MRNADSNGGSRSHSNSRNSNSLTGEDDVPRHLLTAKEIIAARDCDLADGDGLIIRVKGPSITAVLRFTSPVRGSRREMGLGGLRRESLAAAGESLASVVDLPRRAVASIGLRVDNRVSMLEGVVCRVYNG
jgi:hypothetical protein